MDLKEQLSNLTVAQLTDVVVNYETYKYPPEARAISLAILRERNVPQDEIEKLVARLEMHRQERESGIDRAQEALGRFLKNSVYSVVFFVVPIVLLVAGVVMIGRPVVPILIFAVDGISWCVYLIFHVRSINSLAEVEKGYGEYDSEETSRGMAVYFSTLLFSPAYTLYHYFKLRKRIAEFRRQ